MDKQQEKQQDIWDAIGKLKLRDRLLLLFAVIALGVAIAFAFFFLLMRTSVFDFHIPKSTLRDSPDGQGYRLSSYTDLPEVVQFPGTIYATSVGGENHLYNDYVASFRYSEEQLLLLGVFDDTVSIQEFYTYALISAIDTSVDQRSAVYTSVEHDEGYLNALPFTYEGGTLDAGVRYYLVSYIYHTDTGKNLLLMALTSAEKQRELDRSKKLVDKMLYSMRKVGGDKYEDKAESSDKAAGDSGLVGSPSSDKYGFSERQDRTMTDSQQLSQIQQKVDESAYSIAYPDAEDLEYYVSVNEEMSRAYFYIDYTEVNSVPQLAYLMSPSGHRYATTYKNNDRIGLVYWMVDAPEQGNWLIHLSNNARYGQFFADAVSEEEFTDSYIENGHPEPRNAQ